MSNDITYSLNFNDAIALNIVRHALLQDHQIMWYTLRDDFALHQIFSKWSHKIRRFDEDDILKKLKMIVDNHSKDHPSVGYSDSQLSIWHFSNGLNVYNFTETSFNKSLEKLDIKLTNIAKLDQECSEIVQKHFVKIERPLIPASTILKNISHIINESTTDWHVSIEDSIKIGLIYDAIGDLVSASATDSTHSIATPEILYKKLDELLPKDIYQEYSYPEISGTGSELAKIAKLRQALN